MHCTNINHPQIQDWAKEFNTTLEKIGGIVSIWQEGNNQLDEFPSKLYIANQLKLEKLREIIPNLDTNVSFFEALGKNNGIQDKEVLSIPNTWTEEQNRLVTQQYENIEATRQQKKTAEKLMSISNDLSGVTEDSYILKNNTVLNRASSEIDKDSKFKFDKEDFDESKYENNRIWGNQIDDILRAVVLYRFDENQKENVIKEIQKQQSKRNEDSLLSDEVTFKLISEFNKFCQKHSDKIIIPQQFLYNEENKIGGTADIVLVDKYGNVEVVDLKSSVNPVNWTGNYFKNYTKMGENGNEYSNNYSREFGKDRGSKKERHEAQLSMYVGMMNARGINHNETHPIHILPVHIKKDEYSEEMITDATVERNDFPMNLNNIYLNKVNIDLAHNERVLNSYQTEFEQNKNKLILFVKNEIDLQNRIKDKNAKYRVEDLKEMLKVLENNDIANSSKLANYILDLHKTFVSGNFALAKQIKTLVNDIKNGTLEDNDKAILELMKYKEKILFFTPLINELKEFYDDIQEENFSEDNPDSVLFKLDELLNTFKTIDSKYYKKVINPLLAEKYSIATSSEKANRQSEKLLQRSKDKLQRLQTELNEKLQDSNGILDKSRIAYLNYRINSLTDTVYKIENKLIITKDSILKQLNEGSFEDISFIQKMALSPQSSSNVFIAGTAKIVDEIFHNIRMKAIEVQEHIHEAFEEFAKYNKDVNRNNVKEFNKDFYETITTGYIENKALKTTEDLAFVQQIDITKFNEEKKTFLESIKDIKDTKEYWQKYNDWFLQNTENLPDKDVTVDGYAIRKGLDSIIKEKQDDVKNKIITEAQYDYWYKEAFSKDKNGNRIVNYSTKEGRQLRMPLLNKYTNTKWEDIQKSPEKSKYYNSLLTTYLKAQDKYPQRKSNEHRYILPYINKSLLNRVDENGLKNTGKEVIKRTFNESLDNKKLQYGESQLKVIPILYNDKIPMEDVSLDLAQSVLLFDLASKEFEARTKVEPVLKAVQYSLAENKPLKTDSKGRAIITKFAEDLNLPGFDKYVKSSESNIEALFKYYMDNMIYGISREKSILNTPLGEVDAHSLVDSMSGVISRTSLGLPFGLFSNVANWLQGEAQTFIESHSKQFFDTKTYLWAEKEYASLTKDFIKDTASPISKSLIGQLLEIYDPFIGEFKDKYGRNISKTATRKLLTSSPAFFLQNLGEHHVQVKTMLAFLKSTKLKDNAGNETTLYDVYEMNENGKIKLKDGIDLSQLGNTTLNNLLPLSIKSKLNSVLQQTHGNYSKMTAPMLRKYWYGRVLEFMRRFFMTSVEKRWRQSRYNFEKEDLDEGYNRTFWRLLTSEFKELLNVGFGFATGRDNNLTEMEIANLRRNAMDMAFIFATGLLVLILTGMMKNADNDDEKDRIALFLAPIMRLNAELSAFGQIGDPSKGFAPDIGDIKRNLSTPSVMFGYATKTVQFLEQIPKDAGSLLFTSDIQRYSKDTGFYEKGDSKIMAKFLKLFGASPSKMDLTESIKALQLQQNR